MFSPRTEYLIEAKPIVIKDFSEYAEEFVVRPPYQRKSVWPVSKQRKLLDSLFRRYYIPKIVIREVRLDEDRILFEVVDGQQRILTVQRFFAGELTLPKSLADLDTDLPGKSYKDLPVEIKRFAGRHLKYDADVIKGIEDPHNPEHQKTAAEIFWRLQQGESLNFMEIAHARLSSLVRNFVVKYADDIQFNYDEYKPIDQNNDKHPFFKIISRGNERMQQLALLARFVMLEVANGPTDIRDMNVGEFIDSYQRPDGIGDYSFENTAEGQRVLQLLNLFYDCFKSDTVVVGGGALKELSIEYFIVSTHLLLRHLHQHYVFGNDEKKLFHDFVCDFHVRWRKPKGDDTDVLVFQENRQQSQAEIQNRHMILRQLFFDYAADKGRKILTKDEKRAFDESERIAVYRRDQGLCQKCLAAGKPEKEAFVPWDEYEADHVLPHSKGGQTVIENAQLLCRYHNRAKGAGQ